MEHVDDSAVTRQILHICTAYDREFVIPANVMMRSVVENTTSSIHFHLLVPKSQYIELGNHFHPIRLDGKSSFSVYQFDETLIEEHLKMNGVRHFSNAAIFRLFLSDILPCDIDRILYLDGDLVVNLDISQIFTSGDKDVFSARVEKSALGYFNSGVFITSLKYWRQNDVVHRLLAFLKQNPESELKDQDALNHVFCNMNQPLDKKYNFPVSDFKLNGTKKENKIIFHFTGSIKPWKRHAPLIFPVKLWRSFYKEIYNSEILLQNVKFSFIKKVMIWFTLFTRIKLR